MNWLGAINYAAVDQFISMSMAQVCNIPVLRPIYNKERANNMYSTTAYFLAIWISMTLCFIFYPLITSAFSFTYLGIKDDSWDNFLMWLQVLFI